MSKFALIGLFTVFAVYSSSAHAASSWWRSLTDLCGFTAAEEAGAAPANPLPVFLAESLNLEDSEKTPAALAAAQAIMPGFEPTHGPRYADPTPERVEAWQEMLSIVELEYTSRGDSSYDPFFDRVGADGLLTGEDLDLYLRWLVAAGVYLQTLGEAHDLVFQHAHAVGLAHLSFIRSLPADVALLYIQGSPQYDDAQSLVDYLQKLEATYDEWDRLFRAYAARRSASETP